MFRFTTQSSAPRMVALAKVIDGAPLGGAKVGTPHSGETLYINGDATLIPAGKVLLNSTSNKVVLIFGLWMVYWRVAIPPGSIRLERKDSAMEGNSIPPITWMVNAP